MSESSSNAALKQEGFLIAEENVGRRKKIIRQDRIPIEAGRCFLDIDGIRIEVLNISSFGCAAVLSPETAQKIKMKSVDSGRWSAQVFYDGTETQKISLRFAREESHPTSTAGELVWAFETEGEPFKVERLKALDLAADIIAKQQSYAAGLAQVPLAFKKMVYEMKDWLHQLKDSIAELEKQVSVDNTQEAEEFRTTIIESISDYLGQVLPRIYSEIPFLIQGLGKEELQTATDFARAQLGPYVYGAPFAARSFYKPRGYAGDYEMMNHLYRNERAGRTLFDQCMHKYFVDEPAGEAVKNRGYYLLERITAAVKAHPVKSPMKIISIASGPAMEQQLFLQNSKEFAGRSIELTCLDQDEESLKYAQRQLLSLERFVKSGFTFKFNNLAIRNVIARGLPEQDYDLIYSAGLFDYFTEPVAQMAAQKMMAALKPGGRLIIGNFSTDNPCVPFMELVLDWHLIYRSKEDLQRMFHGFGSKVWVETEPLGVNLFVIIEK